MKIEKGLLLCSNVYGWVGDHLLFVQLEDRHSSKPGKKCTWNVAGSISYILPSSRQFLERVREAVDRKVRGVVDGTKQRLNQWKGEVGNLASFILLYYTK